MKPNLNASATKKVKYELQMIKEMKGKCWQKSWHSLSLMFYDLLDINSDKVCSDETILFNNYIHIIIINNKWRSKTSNFTIYTDQSSS